MSFRGITFNNATQVFARDDSTLYDFLLDQTAGVVDNVLDSLETIQNGLDLEVSDGYAMIQGRVLAVDKDTIEIVSIPVATGDEEGYLIIKIDLNQVEGSQASITYKKAASLPSLVQEDLLNDGMIYEYPLYTFTQTVVGITSLTDVRTYLQTQSEVIAEVNARMDLLPINSVLPLVYVSAGKYSINLGDYTFNDKNKLTFKFPNVIVDLDDSVSVDITDVTGTTNYDLILNDEAGSVILNNAVQDQTINISRSGSNIIKNIQQSREKILPYTGTPFAFETPKNGLTASIDSNVPNPPSLVKGRTIGQYFRNGNFRDGTDEITAADGILSIVDDNLRITSTGVGLLFGQLNIFTELSPSNNIYIEFIAKGNKSGNVTVELSQNSLGSGVTVNQSISITDSFQKFSLLLTGSPGIGEVYNHFDIDARSNFNLVSDYIEIDSKFGIKVIVAPSDLTTISAMEKALDDQYFEGSKNAGQSIELDQLLDNRNDFGNYTFDPGITIFDNDDLSYIEYPADGTSKDAYGPTAFEPNETYTILTHVIENTVQEFITVWGAQVGTNNLSVFDEAIGVFKQKFTVGAGAYIENRSLIPSTFSKGKVIARSVIIKGDYTNLTDEEALKIIKNEVFGPFEISGIRWETNNKNIFDDKKQAEELANGNYSVLIQDNGYKITNNLGVTNSSQSRLQSFNLIPLADYVLSADIVNSIAAGTSGTILYIYDSNTILLAAQLTDTANEKTFTVPSDGIVRIKYRAFTANEVSTISNIQLELGTVKTVYDQNKNLPCKLETGKNGLIGIGEVYDDNKTKRFGIDENELIKNATLLNSSFDVTYTNGAIFYISFTELASLGYKVPSSNDKFNASLTIGNEIYSREAISTFENANTENKNMFAVNDANGFYLSFNDIVGKSIIKDDPASGEAYLQANNVKFQFEFEEYLDRTEPNNNLTPINGQLLVGPKNTGIMSGQGIIPEFDVVTYQNEAGTIDAIIEALIELINDLFSLEITVDQLADKVNTLIDEVGYLPELTTTAKSNIVAAINELVADKVDKVVGKELSDNNYTDADKLAVTNNVIVEYVKIPTTAARLMSEEDVTAGTSNGWGSLYSPDGSYLYVLDSTNDTIYQFATVTPYGAIDSIDSSKALGTALGLRGLVMSEDGLKVIVSYISSTNIESFDLVTPFEISTLNIGSKVQKSVIGVAPGGVRDITISKDGTKFYYLEDGGDDTITYASLSPAYDISSLSDIDSFQGSLIENVLNGIAIVEGGSKMLVLGSVTGDVSEIIMPGIYSLTNAVEGPDKYVVVGGGQGISITFGTGIVLLADPGANDVKRIMFATASTSLTDALTALAPL